MIAMSCLEDSIPEHPFSTLAGSYIFLPIFLSVLERDFSIDFELLFPHPLQIFFWPKLFMKMEPSPFPLWIDVRGI